MPTNQLMMFQPPVQQAELPPSQSQMDQSGINCGFPFKHAPAASSSSNANCGFPSKNTSSNANCGFPSKPPNLNSQEGQTVLGSLSLSEMRVPAPAAVKPVTMTSSLSSSNVMNSIAPPPTAFQDNNFYLTETQPANNAAHSSSGKRNSKNFLSSSQHTGKIGELDLKYNLQITKWAFEGATAFFLQRKKKKRRPCARGGCVRK